MVLSGLAKPRLPPSLASGDGGGRASQAKTLVMIAVGGQAPKRDDFYSPVKHAPLLRGSCFPTRSGDAPVDILDVERNKLKDFVDTEGKKK